MTYEQEIEFFNQKVKEMAEVFAKKRYDYGPTTTETFEKFGPVSMLTRMHDKLGRLDNLLSYQIGECMVSTESVEDTLTDLANYAIITILELHKWNKKKTDIRRL